MPRQTKKLVQEPQVDVITRDLSPDDIEEEDIPVEDLEPEDIFKQVYYDAVRKWVALGNGMSIRR